MLWIKSRNSKNCYKMEPRTQSAIVILLLSLSLASCQSQETTPLSGWETLVDKEGLSVTVSDRFPNDVDCKLAIDDFPSVLVTGKKHEVYRACRISFGTLHARKQVSVSRMENERFMLSFSFLNAEGMTQYQFDIDCNGSWDVRRTTDKAEIFLEGKWLEAELVDPPWERAKTATGSYSFEAGSWNKEN